MVSEIMRITLRLFFLAKEEEPAFAAAILAVPSAVHSRNRRRSRCSTDMVVPLQKRNPKCSVLCLTPLRRQCQATCVVIFKNLAIEKSKFLARQMHGGNGSKPAASF